MNAHGTFTVTQCDCHLRLHVRVAGCFAEVKVRPTKNKAHPTHSQLFRVAWFQTRNVQSFLLYEWVFYHRIFAQHQAPCKCTGKTASGVFLFPSPRLFEIGFEKLRPKTSAKTKGDIGSFVVGSKLSIVEVGVDKEQAFKCMDLVLHSQLHVWHFNSGITDLQFANEQVIVVSMCPFLLAMQITYCI